MQWTVSLHWCWMLPLLGTVLFLCFSLLRGGTIKKTKKQIWKVKEGPYCLGFPYHSTGSVAAAAAAFTAAVKVYMEEAAAASLCASNLPVIVLSVFWFMLCFDESGTEVVPSFLHGLLRDGHVLGLRFGRASAAAAFLLQFCSYTAAAFVGVITLVMVYGLLDCDFTVGGQARSFAGTTSSYSLGNAAQGRDESSETCFGSWAEDDKKEAGKKGEVIIDVNTDSFQLMVVTLTGRTLMISVLDDWTVHDLSLRLEKDTGIPRDAFFLTHGPRVLVPGLLREMALSSSSVLRMRGRVRGGGPHGGPHGVPSIPGEWTCGNCGATKCWPVRTRCYRCGMARNGAPSHPIPGYPDPGRPPYPPPGWPREQNALGRSPLPGPTGIAPTISARKMSQAARKAANRAQPAQVSKLQALELLKDELDIAVVESLQARLSQPRVIPPKRPEDLLRSKKIEWEKTETQLAAASAKAEKLREQLVELDQSIIDLGERVNCLKTEWRELKDKLESDTSKKDDESGMDDLTPDEKEDGGEDADYFEPLRYKVRRKFKRAADAERLEAETKAAYDAVNFQGLVSHLMTTTAPDKLPDLLQEMCSNVFARVAETAIAQSGGQVAEGKKAYESLLHNAKQNTEAQLSTFLQGMDSQQG